MGGNPTIKNGWFMALLYPHYFFLAMSIPFLLKASLHLPGLMFSSHDIPCEGVVYRNRSRMFLRVRRSAHVCSLKLYPWIAHEHSRTRVSPPYTTTLNPRQKPTALLCESVQVSAPECQEVGNGMDQEGGLIRFQRQPKWPAAVAHGVRGGLSPCQWRT